MNRKPVRLSMNKSEDERSLSVMDGYCPTNFAPNFGSVFAWRRTCNINFYAAYTRYSGLHGQAEQVPLDELNAQDTRFTHASKHMKTFVGEKPLISSNENFSTSPPAEVMVCNMACSHSSNCERSIIDQPRMTLV